MSKDSVFGEMTYNNSWEREEEEIFFSKIRKYKIVAKAYPGQQILDIQRDAYKKYKSKEDEYFEKIPDALLEYYKKEYDSIKEMVNIPERLDKDHINKESIVKLVILTTLYFNRNGKYGWLCDCGWDRENGICIILSGEKIEVNVQDELI